MKATLAAALLCVAALPSPRAAAADRDGRKAAPNFSLTDASGKRVRISDFKGHVVILDFWATWCHGCKTEIPWFMEFQNRYRQSGLAVLGVAMDDEGWKIVRPFFEKSGMNYTVVVGNEAVAKLYGLDSMPMTVVIDRKGKIAAVHVGLVEKDAFEKEIQDLLNQRRS